MQRPRGLGAWTPAPAYLPKTPGWAGWPRGRPSRGGRLPLAFRILTLVPVWGGDSGPQRPLPSMAAQPESLPGCSAAAPGQAPWSTLPGFLYCSVTFFIIIIILP